MSDTRMVNKIAWMIHEECMEWIENEEDYKKAARKLIEIVRKHDKRLTARALDVGGKADVCQECGAKLTPDNPWCQNCGTRQP